MIGRAENNGTELAFLSSGVISGSLLSYLLQRTCFVANHVIIDPAVMCDLWLCVSANSVTDLKVRT